VPTPSEKKALIFLAAVAITGAGVRATGAAVRAQTADASSRDALRRQIVAVESAGASDRRKRSAGGRKSPSREAATDAATIEGSHRRRSTSDLTELPAQPAIDPRSIFAPTVVQPSQRRAGKKEPASGSPIDVDVATANELERLPRIGPALAQRIVDDRTANGPFGSLDALRRVRGVGPAMVRELTPYVTFSGTPRPSIAGEAGANAATDGTRMSRVRTGAAHERRRRRPAPP
jgi:competence protein ComEA